MYRFRYLDVSNSGPFDREQSLYFSGGSSLINADNGSGKTTIVNTLRREFGRATISELGRENIEILNNFIFFDGEVRTPYGGAPWDQLVSLMSFCWEFSTNLRNFESDLTKNIRQLLAAKIESQSSKFSVRVTAPEQLHASVSYDGVINVTANGEENINDCFQAMGERLVLYLSINDAVRKQLSLDVPFVVDSQLYGLDQWLFQPCFQFIKGVSEQVIVLENSPIVNALSIKANYRLNYHQMTGKSTIEKCA
ncbi:MAG: AAA family ATPase [Desulfuromonadaceae bacterium]